MTRLRVLLVEDEPGYARFLREVLAESEAEAPEVVSTDSLAGAVEALKDTPFDVVLLDLGLPDADGTEALTQVTAVCAAPIVVLSALHDVEVAVSTMRLGAQEYLVKGQAEHALLPRAIRYAVERKRLHDDLEKAKAEAERASAVKDEFLAMLGHELRNPLAPIVTAVALIRQHEGAGAIDREVTILERQLGHVLVLVDDLLDVARISSGKLELHREPLDLREVIDAGVEVARPLVDARAHRLEVRLPDGPATLLGDRSRLTQVIANLVNNAAKYTDAGGLITLSLELVNGTAELRVADNGAGMTPEFMTRVFDMFEQGKRTLDRSAGGLGIGLSIVRSIVTQHGGQVSVASAGPGKGSELTVRLPLVDAARASNAPPAPKSDKKLVSQSRRRVLIVDDNEDGAELLQAVVESLGHTVRVSYDGLSALAAAADFEPDIALIDIGLPGMDGYELAQRFRSAAEKSPYLIAVTGYGQESDRQRAREAGFNVHLVKPVDIRKLATLLAGAAARD